MRCLARSGSQKTPLLANTLSSTAAGKGEQWRKENLFKIGMLLITWIVVFLFLSQSVSTKTGSGGVRGVGGSARPAY